MPGEIISIILKNSVEYVLFYLATLRIGCIINPYPYNLESKDAVRYLENVNPKLLFCHKAHYEYMKNSAQSQVILVDDDFLDKLDGSKNMLILNRNKNLPHAFIILQEQQGTQKALFFHTKTCYLTFHQFVGVLNLMRKRYI